MKYSLNTGERDFGFSKIDFRKDLNDEQYSVVTEADGPCLVLAGAGSGKTRTLVYRVAYLLSMGVPAENILLVTFTNKAAHTMQDRVEMLLKAKPKNLWSGTFTISGTGRFICTPRKSGIRAISGYWMKMMRWSYKICIKRCKSQGHRRTFSYAQDNKIRYQSGVEYMPSYRKILEQNYPYFLIYTYPIKKIAEEYELRKHQANVMDYDDLLTKWLHLLQSVQSVREKFSQQFKYVLVDEYQDTNKLQAEIIKAFLPIIRMCWWWGMTRRPYIHSGGGSKQYPEFSGFLSKSQDIQA
jgi:DNA helicase-2/ATP-dependent DNA helicase PcrA